MCATLLRELFEFQAILELDLLTKYGGGGGGRELQCQGIIQTMGIIQALGIMKAL